MKKLIDSFFKWYNKHLTLNISIAAFLFTLQLVHLYWLFTDVILFKLLGRQFFPVSDFWQSIIILVDYTEIPALLSTGLIYVNELRKKYNFKSALYLGILASQVLHIFWITDTFVVNQFTGKGELFGIPGWLAWIAILIDYLELPVIYDTVKRLIAALKVGDLKKVKESFNE